MAFRRLRRLVEAEALQGSITCRGEKFFAPLPCLHQRPATTGATASGTAIAIVSGLNFGD